MAGTIEDTLRRVIEHPARHLRVLGPPGSGKTRLLVERFRALEAIHGGGVYVLTYSAENHERLTGAVLEKNTGRTGPPRVLTYTRLAGRVLEAAGARAPLIVADLEEHLLLGEVIAERETRLESDLRSICRSERFRYELRETCHLLLQNRVEGERLRALRDAAETTELSDVFLLYEGFREALDARGAATYYDVAWRALDAWNALRRGSEDGRGDEGGGGGEGGERTEQGESGGHDEKGERVEATVPRPLVDAEAVLIDDFQDIDAGQFALVEALWPPDGRVAVNVFGDPMGSVFAHRGTDRRFLAEEFPRLYGGETYRLPARRPEGGVPEATLEALLVETVREEARDYLPVATGPFLGARAREVPSRAVGAESDETRVHGAAREESRVESAAADEARVEGAAPDEGRGGELLRGFCVETVRDEMEEVYVVASRIARLLRVGVCRPEEIAIVTNEKRRYEPLLVAAATQRGVPLDTGRAGKTAFADFADAFLSLVDSPDDPVAARSVLTSPLCRYLEGCASATGIPDAEDDEGAHDALRAFVAQVRRAIVSQEPSRWMEIIVARSLRAVCDAHARATGDEGAYRDACGLLEAWDRYAAAVERWGGRASVGAFAALDASLPRARPAVRRGAVSFLSCREAKGRFFPAVFVVGCSELLFPSAHRRESVLPAAALEKALARACPGPVGVYRAQSADARLREEVHFLAVALTRAAWVLHVTAPEAFSGEDYPAPSALLDRTVPEGLRLRAEGVERIPPQIRFARAWVKTPPSEPPDARLERLSAAGFHWHALRPAAFPVELVPFALSKSTMEAFLACERRFFYRKALRLREAESPPMTVGKLFHEAMAALGERFPTKAALIAGATSAVLGEIVAGVIGKDEKVARTPFYERLLAYHLERMVQKVLDVERSDPEDYTVRAVEKPITYRFGPWEFTGRIDRVHETPDGRAVVVDYKTGKIDKTAKTLHKKTLAALDDPKKANWQLPIYTWGLKATEGVSPGAFTFVSTPPREAPIAVTLFIRRDADDPPPRDAKGRALPHLLESEIESVMERAAAVAGTIFAPRSRFERTEDRNACRQCDFKRLCRREER